MGFVTALHRISAVRVHAASSSPAGDNGVIRHILDQLIADLPAGPISLADRVVHRFPPVTVGTTSMLVGQRIGAGERDVVGRLRGRRCRRHRAASAGNRRSSDRSSVSTIRRARHWDCCAAARSRCSSVCRTVAAAMLTRLRDAIRAGVLHPWPRRSQPPAVASVSAGHPATGRPKTGQVLIVAGLDSTSTTCWPPDSRDSQLRRLR